MLFLRRKKFSCEFHEEPITSIKIVLQRKFLFPITRNPETIGRCLSSSAVFRCVTAIKKNQKSQKERSQLYIECECRTTKMETLGQNWVKIGILLLHSQSFLQNMWLRHM